MPDADERTPYAIEMSEQVSDMLDRLGAEDVVVTRLIALLRDQVRWRPRQLVPGRIKALRGEHSGRYQAALARRYRAIWSVDDDRRAVRLEYLGPHPDWKRGRGRIRP